MAMNQGWGPGPQPVVLDVAKGSRPTILLGAGVLLVFGLIAVGAAVAGAVSGGTGSRTGVGVCGGIMLLIGLLPLVFWHWVFRPRKLIMESRGVRWDDPRGKPWAVGWAEVGMIAVSTAERASRTGMTTLVRLDVLPRDPGFPARHPEMAHLVRHKDGQMSYRLPLGPHSTYLTVVDNGLRRFAPPGLYRGVVDEGFAWGFRYM